MFIEMLAWYAVSNESYINRVIIDVLPTPWSPRNTSLYLAKGVICLFSGSMLSAPVVAAAPPAGGAASAMFQKSQSTPCMSATCSQYYSQTSQAFATFLFPTS